MKRTLVINLFGAPGSGKSTGAACIFSYLKRNGIDCELVTEYAKDKCWEENSFIFDDPDNQFYIGAKQFYRVNRVNGKVDVIVTDSPILLNCFYNKSSLMGEEYNIVAKRLFQKFNNVNFFVNRVKEYNPNGRNQTVDEANQIALDMKKFISQWNVPYIEVCGDDIGYQFICEYVLKMLK